MKSYLSLLFAATLSSVFAVLVYLPGLGGGFVLDDPFNILQNYLLYVDSASVEAFRNAALSFHDGRGGRPLPMLTFALDYWRTGSMNPTAFKVTNLVIHALTTFSLVYLIRRLLLLCDWAPDKAALGAIALAFVWAVHPLQVSSVLYIVQRMQTMATLFIVLALWAYVVMRQVQISGVSRGRFQGVLFLVCALLALGCKEDASLVFAYVLVLELTILRFRAFDPEIAKGLKQSFGLLTLLAVLGFLFVVVPHYWSWEAYSGRGFSSIERLMTQARVLVMYMGQIAIPWPDSMTFIYDNYPVSTSLWSPWSTLPCLLIVFGLVCWAWRWRDSRPLFSSGVFLFFAGHFIASNIIPLELVFEHRNHFPLLGAVMALGDLLVMAWQRWNATFILRSLSFSFVALVLILGSVARAYTWGDSVRHGEKQVELLPESTRAWTQLGGAHFDNYKETGDSAHLQRAVDVNAEGLKHVKAPPLASNLVIYKSLLGTISEEDWQVFWEVLREAPKSWQDKFVVWTMMSNVDKGFDIDSENVIASIKILAEKAHLSNKELLRMAVFVYKYGEPSQAYPLFLRYAKNATQSDENLERILGELEAAGHETWVQEMRSSGTKDSGEQNE